jgi:hypothetical protein
MMSTTGLRAIMAVLAIGAVVSMTGCAADNEPDTELPPPKQVTLSAPGVVDTTPEQNAFAQAPAPNTETTTGTGGTGAQVTQQQPRLTPKK